MKRIDPGPAAVIAPLDCPCQGSAQVDPAADDAGQRHPRRRGHGAGAWRGRRGARQAGGSAAGHQRAGGRQNRGGTASRAAAREGPSWEGAPCDPLGPRRRDGPGWRPLPRAILAAVWIRESTPSASSGRRPQDAHNRSSFTLPIDRSSTFSLDLPRGAKGFAGKRLHFPKLGGTPSNLWYFFMFFRGRTAGAWSWWDGVLLQSFYVYLPQSTMPCLCP